MIPRFLLFLAAVPVLDGCVSSPFGLDTGGEFLLQTDTTSYMLSRVPSGWRVKIHYRFENRTGRRVFLVNCNGYVGPMLERKSGDSWVTGWVPAEAACLSPPVVIETDQTFSDSLIVFAGEYGGRTHPQFSTAEIEGTYRLVWRRALSSFDANRFPFGPEIPLGDRISNEFLLREP